LQKTNSRERDFKVQSLLHLSQLQGVSPINQLKNQVQANMLSRLRLTPKKKKKNDPGPRVLLVVLLHDSLIKPPP